MIYPSLDKLEELNAGLGKAASLTDAVSSKLPFDSVGEWMREHSLVIDTIQETLKGLQPSLDVAAMVDLTLPSSLVIDTMQETLKGLQPTIDAKSLLASTVPLLSFDIEESLKGLYPSVNAAALATAVLPSSLVLNSPVQLPYGDDAISGPDTAGMSPLDIELWAQLSTLGTEFQEMHEGAWDALVSSRPDDRRHSAHSARELLDWTLRHLAPDAVFSADEVRLQGQKGRPTRRMRARYILGRHKKDVTFVEAMATAIVSVHGALAAVAHTGESGNARLRGLLRGCEAALLVLLATRDQFSPLPRTEP